jgi:hypothetical protein
MMARGADSTTWQRSAEENAEKRGERKIRTSSQIVKDI